MRQYSEGFTIRPATSEDLRAAQALMRTVVKEDLNTDYNPNWHWDIDDPQGVYLDNPRHTLLVAVDDVTGEIIATGGVRARGPQTPPDLQWIADKYFNEETAQLTCVYVARDHRRRGIARVMVERLRQFIAEQGSYHVIYLHTDPQSPGALPFWQAMPTTLVFDPRGKGYPDDPNYTAIHFELAFPDPVPAAGRSA